MLHQSSFQCIRGRKDPNRYRAVTVTSVITKCFEFVLLEGLQRIPEDTVFLPLWVKLKKMYGIHDQETTLLTYCITHRKSSALNHSDRVSSELCNLGLWICCTAAPAQKGDHECVCAVKTAKSPKSLCGDYLALTSPLQLRTYLGEMADGNEIVADLEKDGVNTRVGLVKSGAGKAVSGAFDVAKDESRKVAIKLTNNT